MMSVPQLLRFRNLLIHLRANLSSQSRIFLQKRRLIVSDAVVFQYVGFETKGAEREYMFTLRGSGGGSAEYFVAIANAAFLAHRVRYQDAPDICSARLHREFSSKITHPPSTRFCITDAELADYREAHAPKSRPNPSAYREHAES